MKFPFIDDGFYFLNFSQLYAYFLNHIRLPNHPDKFLFILRADGSGGINQIDMQPFLNFQRPDCHIFAFQQGQ